MKQGPPAPLAPDEPERVAEAAARLGLHHVVVTSVSRDDLPDGGASQFAVTVQAVRRQMPEATVEVLVPDFNGSCAALERDLDQFRRAGCAESQPGTTWRRFLGSTRECAPRPTITVR